MQQRQIISIHHLKLWCPTFWYIMGPYHFPKAQGVTA